MEVEARWARRVEALRGLLCAHLAAAAIARKKRAVLSRWRGAVARRRSEQQTVSRAERV